MYDELMAEHTLVKSLMPTESDVNSCTVHTFRAASLTTPTPARKTTSTRVTAATPAKIPTAMAS